MRVMFGTIVLNEAQLISSCIGQHLPMLGPDDRWIIVEGADRCYPREHVSPDGLSTDGTADIVRAACSLDGRIKFVQHGFADGKHELRNVYAQAADELLGDDGALVVVDVDEFLTRESWVRFRTALERLPGPGVVRIPHVHLWQDQDHVVTGGYWDVPHDRAYRWTRGCRYGTGIGGHNHPQSRGRLLRDGYRIIMDRHMRYTSDGATHLEPFWLHYANCKDVGSVAEKNQYYVNRGEATDRPCTTRCRAAVVTGDLPAGVVTHKWIGPIPEVFRA